MSLQQFQLDIAARLQGVQFFADVPVFVLRPRAALTATEIQDRINAALGMLNGESGKAGLCLTVLMPKLTTERPELPGPYLHLQCAVRVQENVMINMGTNGTLIACEDAAIMVARSLHLWTPGGTAGIVRVAPETIVPNGGHEGKLTYDVQVESELDLECVEREAQPFIMFEGGIVSIACPDRAAQVYYTTDATTPWAGSDIYESTATLYTAPFAAPAGTLIRAAAYAMDKLGSDVAWLQV